MAEDQSRRDGEASESSVATADLVVEDNREESRYEARIGDRVVGIAEYEMADEGGPITFTHTEVLPDAEGDGVGGRLARGAVYDVQQLGGRLIAQCEFISTYLKRHREYDDLIAR